MSDQITAPPATAHPKIHAIFEYWRKAHLAGGRLPGRRDIDPIDIPKLLDNVWLLDVIGRPARFRLRLIGGALKRMELKGKVGDYLDGIVADGVVENGLKDFHITVNERRPVWFRGKALLSHHHEMFELERLFLPLAADGSTVDMLLCLTVFYALSGPEI